MSEQELSQEVQGIEVIGPNFSTFTRTIKMALNELQLPFTVREHTPHSPQVLKYNPFGLVPVLIHNDCTAKRGEDIVLYESNAIRRYIDEHLAIFATRKFRPLTPTANERILSNAVIARAKLDGLVSIISCAAFIKLEHEFIKPALSMKEKGSPEEEILSTLHDSAKGVKHILEILESKLFVGPFLSGSEILWDDLYLFPILDDLRSTPLYTCVDSKSSSCAFPKLAEWLAMMLERQSAVDTRAGTISENVA